jgi:hypothetical protein
VCLLAVVVRVGSGTGYSGYDEAVSRGGQCWAQACNPCGRIARSFFTDKFRLRDAAGNDVKQSLLSMAVSLPRSLTLPPSRLCPSL